MSITRDTLRSFYQGTDYWPRRRALRPRELHVPLEIGEQLKKALEGKTLGHKDSKLCFKLPADVCHSWAPIFLHESLFHFYKAFYNYLAARTLYFGGLLHWIEITTYYAKFFLARSLTTLVGRQSYVVDPTKSYYVREIALILGGEESKKPLPYRVRVQVDFASFEATITLDRGRVSSHRDVWEDYSHIPHESLGVYNLLHRLDHTSTGFITDNGPDYLSKERNEENYSFEGYMQLDFNLDLHGFKQYFKRDFVKHAANRLYDMLTGEVLLAFSRQYDLYRSLCVKDLPIEVEKFEHMITYCLPDSRVRDNLIQLCREGFPTRDLWSSDGDIFYDETGRAL